MKITLLISTAFILTTATKDMACEQPVRKKVQTSFYNTKWTLRKLSNKDSMQTISINSAYVIFNEEKKSAGGKGGCNSFGGTLTVSKDKLGITNIFSTKMYCEGVQDVENAFLKQLGEADRFEVAEGKLRLYKGDKFIVEFEKAVAP